MTVASKILGRLGRLGPRQHAVGREVNLEVKVRDGTILLADRYFPADRPDGPLVLVRTPYGRTGVGALPARVFAERGYQCVVQSCRGTFGSGGEFVPFVFESDDGADTAAWLRDQSWCDGRIAMFGASYLGYTQWSTAAGGAALAAAGLSVTASTLRPVLWPEGVFGLDVALTWAYVVQHQEEPGWRVLLRGVRQRSALKPGFAQVPLVDADRAAMGAQSEIFQSFVVSESTDAELWTRSDRDVSALTAPAQFVAGWYDLFLVAQLDDFSRLAAAGHQPSLIVGPWMHMSPKLFVASLRENLAWYDTHLRDGGATTRRAPVRVFVMGADRWIDLDTWPPPSVPRRLHLHGGGRLTDDAPANGPPDAFTYDPEDPTPSVGGPVLGLHAGARDNQRLEARADVLTYTSAPFTRPLTTVGAMSVHLELESEVPHIDVFARVCDVAARGKSINIADRLVRLGPDDFDANGAAVVDLELSPVGHCFRPGHRLRLQISGGAHPRFARNLGTGEAAATGVRMVSSTRRIHHAPSHPSWVDVPVYSDSL